MGDAFVRFNFAVCTFADGEMGCISQWTVGCRVSGTHLLAVSAVNTCTCKALCHPAKT